MSTPKKDLQATDKPKVKYQLKNWSAYNKALENRGSITLYFDDELINYWYADPVDENGERKPGAQTIYSDRCVESIMMLKSVFQLPYRQVVGFTKILLKLMQIEDLKMPSYTQLCRRVADLKIEPYKVPKGGPVHIAFDSTGVKVYGEGEWKVRKHGISKRRTWRKLHIGADAETGFIPCHTLTLNDVDDASQLDDLLDQVEGDIDSGYGDGAYDTVQCWDTLVERDIKPIIPPRQNAVEWYMNEPGDMDEYPRNIAVNHIEAAGRKTWKIESGYHKRSLSETAMFRYKTIFGPVFYSRSFEKQQIESSLKIKILNIMTAQGMPDTYACPAA